VRSASIVPNPKSHSEDNNPDRGSTSYVAQSATLRSSFAQFYIYWYKPFACPPDNLGSSPIHRGKSPLFQSKISVRFSWLAPLSSRGKFAMRTSFFQVKSKSGVSYAVLPFRGKIPVFAPRPGLESGT